MFFLIVLAVAGHYRKAAFFIVITLKKIKINERFSDYQSICFLGLRFGFVQAKLFRSKRK